MEFAAVCCADYRHRRLALSHKSASSFPRAPFENDFNPGSAWLRPGLFLAHKFFVFSNRHATLGIGAPALGGPVPIEEYLFYVSGFIAILLIYIWLDEFWLAAYNVPDYMEEAQKNSKLLVFHPTSAVLGVLLVAAAVGYKRFVFRLSLPVFLAIDRADCGRRIPAVGFDRR